MNIGAKVIKQCVQTQWEFEQQEDENTIRENSYNTAPRQVQTGTIVLSLIINLIINLVNII